MVNFFACVLEDIQRHGKLETVLYPTQEDFYKEEISSYNKIANVSVQ